MSFQVYFTPELQRQCSEDVLIQGKTGLLLFLFSIWEEGSSVQYEPKPICFEICASFLLC